jgi:hypothetical protein
MNDSVLGESIIMNSSVVQLEENKTVANTARNTIQNPNEMFDPKYIETKKIENL